jgi:hypothetical protein
VKLGQPENSNPLCYQRKGGLPTETPNLMLIGMKAEETVGKRKRVSEKFLLTL